MMRDTTVANGTIEVKVGSHKEGIAKQSWNEVEGRALQIIVDPSITEKYIRDALFLGPFVFREVFLDGKSPVKVSWKRITTAKQDGRVLRVHTVSRRMSQLMAPRDERRTYALASGSFTQFQKRDFGLQTWHPMMRDTTMFTSKPPTIEVKVGSHKARTPSKDSLGMRSYAHLANYC